MRLLSIAISGFRGLSQLCEFDLDADAVIVIGANGCGKTSLFDGILWALSGRIPRLHNDNSRLVSLYSETGQARVSLRLKDSKTGKPVSVTRSFDGKEGRIALETSEGELTGPSAEGKLIDLIWPDAAAASEPLDALASVLTRSIYLQQDLVRHFVDATTVQERFTAVSELVGAGRVTELQANLERSKRAWSTVTNQRQEELNPLRERMTLIEERLSEMADRSSKTHPPISAEEWNIWWQRVAKLEIKVKQVEQTSRDASTAIDNAIQQLEAHRHSTERRLQTLTAILNEITELASLQLPDIKQLQENVATLQKQLRDLRDVTTKEQVRLADLRQSQASLKDKTEQLRALASLALKHLEEHCPVCAQTYDREATRIRLEEMVKSGIDESKAEKESPEKLTELLNAITKKEKEVSAAEVALRSGEQAGSEWRIARQTIGKRLREIVGETSTTKDQKAQAERASKELNASLARIIELQRDGESLALRLAQISAVAKTNELRRELETLRKNIDERTKVITARAQTGEQAQRVIEALREASSAVVEERLKEISPLFQSIWSRIDPHPAFRLVTFFSQVFRGRGQLSTIVSDPIEEIKCELPESVLSSSQVNALAVSVFLALNIGIPEPPLSTAILDDPLLSLDDVNLLGLVDLFRRTKDQRQLIVSTHDSRFGDLLSRKLRPRGEKERALVIEMNSWSRMGPKTETREVKGDPIPLRLIESKV